MNSTRLSAIVSFAAAAVAASAQYSTGFETPTFVSGAVASQDGWTRSATTNDFALVQTKSQLETALSSAGLSTANAVHSGDQALLVSGAGSGGVRRVVSGLETATQVQVNLWARPLDTAAGAEGNTFLTMETAAGVRAAAVRFSVNSGVRTIAYYSGGWKETAVAWDPNSWVNIQIDADYTKKTYDVFLNGTKVTASPVGFYTATSSQFNQLYLFRGANQSGMIVDDVKIAPVPEPTSLAAIGLGLLAMVRRGKA